MFNADDDPDDPEASRRLVVQDDAAEAPVSDGDSNAVEGGDSVRSCWWEGGDRNGLVGGSSCWSVARDVDDPYDDGNL